VARRVLTAGQERPRSRTAVVSALGVTQILAWGTSYYLPAVLAKPIADDTGWPLAWVIGGLSLGLLVSGLASPYVGRAIDRRGGRPVLATSAVLLSLGLALLGMAGSIAFYMAAWLVIGLGMSAGLYDPAFSTLGRLYGSDARRAITMLTLWGGFASTVCWPLSALLVSATGWRGTCWLYAAVQLGIVLPLYLVVLPRETRQPPQDQHRSGETLPASAVAAGRSPSQRRLLLVLIASTITVSSVLSSAMSVHLLTILQARGMDLAAAVGLGALVGPSQVGARIVEMLIGRFHHPIWTKAASVLLVGCGLALLWQGLGPISLALVFYGAGIGIESIARGTLPLAVFGARGHAILMGRIAMASLIAQAAAPSAAALLLAHGGAALTLRSLTLVAVLNIAGVATLWACLGHGRPRSSV
jgi:MFS family permease